MRVESSPQGKLMETLLATAFEAHPYQRMPGGWASDITSLRVKDAEAFYRTYYTPGNISIAIVGDIDPKQARTLAEKYFGRLAAAPLPPLVHTVEPPQEGSKRTQVESPSQPLAFIAYKRPDQYDKDDAAIDVMSSLLAGGRTGILYKEMVRDQQIAVAVGAEGTFPGGKYPNLFLFFMAPSLGHTIEENVKVMDGILDRFKAQDVDPQALARVKTKTRAELVRRLDSNSGLAQLLNSYYVNYGNWRRLFTELDETDKVTAQDVQRVARQYLTPKHRTAAYTMQPAPESKP
jgi:predicted Zn-dependent peptidase